MINDDRILNFEPGHLHSQAGFRCIEMRHREEFEMPSHSHTEAHVALVFSGIIQTCYDRTVETATKLTVAYTPPNFEHSCHYLSPVKAFYMILEPHWLDSFELSKSSNPLELGPSTAATSALRIYDEYCAIAPGKDCVIEGHLIDLVSSLQKVARIAEGALAPKWLIQCQEMLHEHPLKTPFISQIAEQVGIHPVHLMRSFQSHFGCSIGVYARRLRISELCRRMKQDTSIPIGLLAAQAGFTDHAYFTNFFRRLTGLSPSDFQARLRA